MQKFVEFQGFSSRFVAAAILLAVFSGCSQKDNSVAANDPAAETPPVSVASALPAPAKLPTCRDDGHLKTELIGALAGPLDWSGAALECSGMPRPNGAGARLRFAGQVADSDRRLALIIALPDLERDIAGTELSSKITLIDESSGRFFSTWELENCWTDISSVEPSDESGDRFSLSGILYCVAPLAEVNGDGSVSIAELSFAGSLDWSAK